MSESKNTSTASDDSGAGLGLKRRTILTGAAWTVPIMVAATTTPAFAASNDLTLKFDKSSYSGTACGTITGAKVTATQGNQPAPGQSITVTLPSGWTFADGSTSSTGTSGSDGSRTLPDIKVPSRDQSASMSAVSGSANTSAELVATDAKNAGFVYNSAGNGSEGATTDGRTTQIQNVPSSAVPIGDSYFFDKNSGAVYFGTYNQPAKVIAQNVSSAVGYTEPSNGAFCVNYVTSAGGFVFNSGGNGSEGANTGGRSTQIQNVPSSAVPIGDSYFFDKNSGAVYFGTYNQPAKVIAQNVSSAVGYTEPSNGAFCVNYITSAGGFVSNSGGNGSQGANTDGRTTQIQNVPSSAVPIGDSYFFDKNSGAVYFGTYNQPAKVIAQNVSSAVGYTEPSNGAFCVNYITSAGGFVSNSGGNGSQGANTDGRTTQIQNVPSSAVPIGDSYFFDENTGDVYFGTYKQPAKVIAQNVSSAVGYTEPSNGAFCVDYVAAPNC